MTKDIVALDFKARFFASRFLFLRMFSIFFLPKCFRSNQQILPFFREWEEKVYSIRPEGQRGSVFPFLPGNCGKKNGRRRRLAGGRRSFHFQPYGVPT